MNKIVFGVGIVLAVLAVLTAPATADNVIRLEPSDISCGLGEEVTDVWVYLNATDGVSVFQFHLKYEDDIVDIVNITNAVEGTNPDWVMWGPPTWKVAADGHHYLFVTGSLLGGSATGNNIELAKISLKGLSNGTRPLEFLTTGEDPTQIGDVTGEELAVTVMNGIFTCGVTPETFSKDLVEGWNLISLPLTPLLDNSTSAVLGGTIAYDAVYSYNTATKQFEDVKTGTMDPGIGYFVHVTTPGGTWTYNGVAKTSMSVPLEQGLNMVGWLNCSKGIGDGLSSIAGNYYYVASWNAGTQEFETYNPVAPNGFNDFADMDRGEGYFISMKTGDTLGESC